MKIGYPCINRIIGCTANKSFRLANYTSERFIQTAQNNINCLEQILNYNKEHGLLFFRISSQLIPFASHPICTVDWKTLFIDKLQAIGKMIITNNMRISMHPDQFVLINALDQTIIDKSVAELQWHAELLDSMGLDTTHKIQIHIGGAYGDKKKSMDRFIEQFDRLPKTIAKRLAIENDDTIYTLSDCLYIANKTGIPIIFDTFHHECNNAGESIDKALSLAQATWNTQIMMIDYSSQQPGERKGKHATHIDINNFAKICQHLTLIECDIMLEIKDKEKSALQALKFLKKSEFTINKPSSTI